jgi:hypothetical protein
MSTVATRSVRESRAIPKPPFYPVDLVPEVVKPIIHNGKPCYMVQKNVSLWCIFLVGCSLIGMLVSSAWVTEVLARVTVKILFGTTELSKASKGKPPRIAAKGSGANLERG